MVMIRSAYDGVKVRQQVICKEKTKTKQSLKKETDINFIMDKFRRTGVIDHLSGRRPSYTGDFCPPSDFAEAMDIVNSVNSRFETLPDVVKNAYKSPQDFLEAVDSLGFKKAIEDVLQVKPDEKKVENK